MIRTPWGGEVRFRPSTTSTMDDAQALEDSGLPDGTVAWAGYQTAGRGRHPGRKWQGQPGDSLLMTVFWDPYRFRVPGFAPSLTVGLGVCLWLERLGTLAEPRLKWPNDVYLGEGKVAGILVRRRLGGAGRWHAGIGVNLRTPGAEHEYRTPPASLAQAGWNGTPEAALEGLLPALAEALDHPDPRQECVKRLFRRGQTLRLALPEGRLAEGTVRDLDANGALVWEVEGSLQVLSSAE